MDSNTLKHLEFFSVPNNQTLNPVDQTFNLTESSSSAAQTHSIWGTSGLPGDLGTAGSPSTVPTSLSLDSYAQASGSSGLTNMSPTLTSPSRQSYGQSRQILPTRPPRTREGHQRKRSKLGTDTTPLDSVDYWIQFDNDEQNLADIPEGSGLGKAEGREKGKAPQRTDSTSTPRPTMRSTNTSTGPAATRVEDFVDDSALDNALSDDEEGFSSMNLADHLSKIDSMPPSEVPPREGLYSTPLSWEKPQPGIRMESLIGLNSPMLNEAEQRRLIAIAMNPGPSMGGLGSNLNFGALRSGLNSTLGGDLGASMGDLTDSMPQPKSDEPKTIPPVSKKQGSVSEKGKEKPKPGDRTAHNDIERKYRTNLKDRIAELKNAVPALHTISENGGEDDGSQPARTAKVSKGAILTKATEYIHQLERKNRQIVQEHRELSRRLQAFEQLLNATARPTFQIPNYSRTLFDPRGFC